MQNPLLVITDKVMRMFKSMVYLAMAIGCRRGATPRDIAEFLRLWAPSERNLYHEGVVERVLFDLQNDGRVREAGSRWYLVGVPSLRINRCAVPAVVLVG